MPIPEQVQASLVWLAMTLNHLVAWEQSPILFMVLVQLAGAGMQVWIKEVIKDYDLSPFILIFFRQVVSSFVLAPATLLERNTRPPLTWRIVAKIACCSIFGIVSNQCFFITGLKYTTAPKASAIANVLPVITFLIGYFAHQETLNLTVHGVSKCIGTLGCVGGAILISVYKGPLILSNSGLFFDWHSHGTHAHESALGPIFVSISCISAAVWFTILANLKNTYNAPLTTTCLTSCMSILPLGVIAFSFEHDMSVWRAMGAMEYGLALYSGAIGTALSVYLMNICVNLRGSHFTTMFSPTSLLLVAILSWIFTNDVIYLGSLLGFACILFGLALALWAMHRERLARQTGGPNQEDV